jgi:hypothetical protein
VTNWRSFYDSIELTPTELAEAIFEGKVKKYFRLKAEQREQQNGMCELRESKDRKQRPDVMRYVRPNNEAGGENESAGTERTDSEG